MREDYIAPETEIDAPNLPQELSPADLHDEEQHDVLAWGSLVIDRRGQRALADGRSLGLTRSEFRLLNLLLGQPGRAFTRAELISQGLGEDTLVLERTIDVHILSVRRKLGEHARAIETIRGVGYRFRADRTDAAEAVDGDDA
jgi:two-component system, OmpR family, phosphate regulon response regulator PhoB